MTQGHTEKRVKHRNIVGGYPSTQSVTQSETQMDPLANQEHNKNPIQSSLPTLGPRFDLGQYFLPCSRMTSGSRVRLPGIVGGRAH